MTENREEDKVEIFSVAGDKEASFKIDRFKLTVGISTVSVIVIIGGLIWLASEGADAMQTSNTTVVPTGQLDFRQKDTLGAQTQQSQEELPVPEVKNSSPLKGAGSPSKTTDPTKSPSPTPTNNPTPTNTPASQQVGEATATPTPTPTPVTELKIEDITVGEGPEVKNGDNIVINYIGTLTNGTKFDSSYDRGTPFETQIGVGKVIKGWDEGVIGMKPGGKRKLIIPADKAYGAAAQPNIPANSALIFEVVLVEIK